MLLYFNNNLYLYYIIYYTTAERACRRVGGPPRRVPQSLGRRVTKTTDDVKRMRPAEEAQFTAVVGESRF